MRCVGVVGVVMVGVVAVARWTISCASSTCRAAAASTLLDGGEGDVHSVMRARHGDFIGVGIEVGLGVF